MKENVLDVLMYLLQNAPLEDEPVTHNQESLKSLLVEAGFANGEIHEAFKWLDDLGAQIKQQDRIESGGKTTRCFAPAEEDLLDIQCRNYLLGLVNNGILSANSFELVMDRVLALAEHEISLDELEWVVLVVLSNQSDEQAALERLEAMAFNEQASPLN